MKQEIEVFESKPGHSVIARVEYWGDWTDEQFERLVEDVEANFPKPKYDLVVRKQNRYV